MVLRFRQVWDGEGGPRPRGGAADGRAEQPLLTRRAMIERSSPFFYRRPGALRTSPRRRGLLLVGQPLGELCHSHSET